MKTDTFQVKKSLKSLKHPAFLIRNHFLQKTLVRNFILRGPSPGWPATSQDPFTCMFPCLPSL